MLRRLVILIGLLAVAVSTGCNRNNAAVSVPANALAVAPQSSVIKTSIKAEERSQTVDAKSIPAKKPQPKAVQPAANVAKKPEKVAVTHSERMAVLTAGGPIVMDVLLTIDGRSHQDAFEEVVSQVLKAADSDKDGRSTWKELAGNKDYLTANGENG